MAVPACAAVILVMLTAPLQISPIDAGRPNIGVAILTDGRMRSRICMVEVGQAAQLRLAQRLSAIANIDTLTQARRPFSRPSAPNTALALASAPIAVGHILPETMGSLAARVAMPSPRKKCTRLTALVRPTPSTATFYAETAKAVRLGRFSRTE